MNDCERESLNIIQSYPMMNAAFHDYVIYICNKVPEDEREWYDLFKIVSERNEERLTKVENRLRKAADILGLNADQFSRQFDFNTLRTNDPEKLYDVLAEPSVVIDLHQMGFGSIKKLPEVKTSEGSKRVADFTAILEDCKFAIEVKTVSPERVVLEIGRMSPEEYVDAVRSGKALLGDSTRASWWLYKCRDDIIRKIEDKNRRAIEQLDNTYKHERCNHKLLVIYSFRHGPPLFMDSARYRIVLQDVKTRYSEIDYLGYKEGLEERPVFHPDLLGQDYHH